ncbi:MAG: acyl transferase [Saprospiraceae bacterium]|nr:acyl transferase [Saprospiraceae bacterium]
MVKRQYTDRWIAKLSSLSDQDFEGLALEAFQYQAASNPLYRSYLDLLQKDPKQIHHLADIPFLPIRFFKNQTIKTEDWTAVTTFSSSSTTGQQPSLHHLYSAELYESVSRQGFEFFYGDISEYCVLALLPSYLERSGSSLVYMADYFIRQSHYKESGFFLHDLAGLASQLEDCRSRKFPTLLIGVSFALLDLAEQFPMPLGDTIVMETGGMKGRRKEMTREELHQTLSSAFQVQQIHSEYGMTELLSQAYSKGEGLFWPSPTMRVLGRDITDPLSPQKLGQTAALNIIDLANINTISFIATEDIGQVYADHSFRVMGRLDKSDIRGCNLMVADL